MGGGNEMSQSVVKWGDVADCSFAVKTIRDNSELSVKKLCNFIKNETNSPYVHTFCQ